MESNQIEYYKATGMLDEYGTLVCSLIKALLNDANIQVHSITYRVKDFDSVLRKLSLKADRYDSLSELTDLLGVRIVTYFNSDIDKVATVINREFDIDTENSVDKREVLNTNEFGYLSLHFIAAISEKRSKFIEYKNFKKIQFEIQVRTILQHAWAEIEHDLGYKSKVELPENISRRFFRLAGSLELADEEFERLRSDISAYETTVDEEIKVSPKNLPINQSTIVASYENENILNELDRIVAVERGATLRVEIDPKYMARQADSIRTLGIKNIEQLHSEARKYSGVFALFARAWLNRSASSQRSSKRLNSLPASRGIGLFYLAYIIAANSTEDQISGWGKHIFGDTGKLMDEVRNAWKKVLDEKDT